MIEYILIATVILLSGSIWGWAIPAITVVQMILSLAYFLYKKGIHKMQIQKSNMVMVSFLLTVYIFNMIVLSKLNIFSKSNILILAAIICLFFIAESIVQEVFVNKYINIIFVMSVMSLLFWALAIKGIMIAPMIVDPGNGNIYRMNLFYIYRAYSDISNLNEFNARNFGIFWEGGAYQAFINIALFWLIDQKQRVKYFIPKAIVFVLTIITTFSSTGYFILILNLLFYVHKSSGKLNFKKIIMLVSAIIVTIFILNSPAVVNKFSSDSSDYISYTIRANDNLNGVKVALYSPVWGLGYQSANYYSELESVGIKANSSGILSTAQEFGVIFMIFLVFTQCKNFNATLSKKNLSTALIASMVLLLIFSSEAIMLNELFLLLAFHFAFQNQPREKYTALRKGAFYEKKINCN